MEIYERKQNLLFYNLPKKTPENARKEVCDTIIQLGFTSEETSSMPSVNAHHLSRKSLLNDWANQCQTPNPMIMRLGSTFDSDSALHAFEIQIKPQETHFPFSIRTDLPLKLNAVRYNLERIANNQQKNHGKSTRIRLGGTELILEQCDEGKLQALCKKIR